MDGGKSWTRSGPITVPPNVPRIRPATGAAPDGIIQPSIVQLGPKRLRMYARSTASIGRICVADSTDNGVTWSQARSIGLPNPDSGIDAIALRDGRIVLIYNDSDKERTPLNLAVSKDGEHFQLFWTLEDRPGEYSYPALIQARGGDLLITYTWNRKLIRFVQFPLSKVPQ